MIPELTAQGIPPQSIAGLLAGELRAAPHIRELLLREMLTEDFLALPQRVASLEDALRELRRELMGRIGEVENRLAARIDGTNARIDGTNARIDGTNERIDGTNERIDGTNERIDETRDEFSNRMDRMEGHIRTLQGQVGNLRGESYEDECRRRIRLVLVEHMDAVDLADRDRIDALVAAARRAGRLTRQQFDHARVIDIIARGIPDGGQSEILAVVEASITINEQDVRNAALRAELLRDLTGEDAAAFCVAHLLWSDALAEIARQLGVTLIHYALPKFDAELPPA